MRNLVGRLARQILHLVPDGTVVPILRGPLRGQRWTTGSLTSRCWLGGYEPERQSEFMSLIARGDVVLDVGANVGFYSLLAAQAVGATGRVVAFEPLPRNVERLRRHLDLNRIEVVEVVQAAVANSAGRRRFSRGEYGATGRLTDDGEIEIPAVSLDELHSTGELQRVDVIKIDVEGAELEVLQGARRVLERLRPRLVVELHNPEMDRECPKMLRGLGYQIMPMDTWEDGITVRGGFTALPGPART